MGMESCHLYDFCGQFESDEGDLKHNGACHTKTPPISIQFSTITAPQLPPAPHKISNSLLVSFLAKTSTSRYT